MLLRGETCAPVDTRGPCWAECRNGVQTETLFQGPPNNRVHTILTTEMFSISSKKPPQNRNKQKVKSVKLRTTKTQHLN